MTTKTAPTPGPWTIDDNEMDIRVEAGCKLGVDTTVAIIPGDSREPEANAILIAAAPELLEAVKLFVRAFPYEREFIEGSAQYKAVKAGKAALDKAKGDTP